MKKTLIAVLSSGLIFSTSFNMAIASQSDIAQEINSYAEVFSGSNYIKQRSVMDRLAWAGLSSEQVYDPIEEKLRSSLDTKDKEKIEQASWFAKTLALSGNEKYRPILEQASTSAKSAKLKKYSKTALKRLDKYKAWNPVISQGLASAPTGQLEEARVINMLNASDYELVRIGAKRAYKEFSDSHQVVSSIGKKLETETNISKSEDMRIDAVAWLLKVIGGTANPEYRTVVENVIANNKNAKIRKYAKKALKSL